MLLRAPLHALRVIVLLFTLFTLTARPASAEIWAYADKSSYWPGESLALAVSSTEPLATYKISRFAETNEVFDTGTLTGLILQDVPDSSFAYGCNWQTSATFSIGQDWPTGAYDIQLDISSGDREHVPFTLKPADPDDGARIVYVRSISTFQAYNYFGGGSYYYPSFAERSHVVSFRRPYRIKAYRGAFNAAEKGLLTLLDEYDVHYYDSLDLHLDPSILERYRTLITAYHDEYVSRPMYDAYSAFRDRGDNILFLAANNIYYQIRYDPVTRQQTCYKASHLDPIMQTDPSLATGHWRHEPLNRPEEALVGVTYNGWMPNIPGESGIPSIVVMPDHWAFVGTGVVLGSEIGVGNPQSLIAGEWDHTGEASPNGIQILMERPLPDHLVGGGARPDAIHQATYYEMNELFGFPGGSGARVFASGSNYFGAPLPFDSALQRFLHNLIQAFADIVQVDLAINLGGSALSAPDLVADQPWSGSGYGHTGGVSELGDPTPGDSEAPCSQAFATLRTGAFEYHVDVAPGFYLVELGMWQDEAIGPGERVVDVLAEGVPIAQEVDLASLRGDDRGQSMRHTVRVEDGRLDLEFQPVMGQPGFAFLHVLQVWPDLTSPSPPFDLTVTAEPGGRWVSWEISPQIDVATYEVQVWESPDPLLVMPCELTRQRAWIADDAIFELDLVRVSVVAIDDYDNRSAPSESILLSGLPTDAPIQMTRTRSRIRSAAPTPFNPEIVIEVLVEGRLFDFAIYDLAGRRVRELRTAIPGTGSHRVRWNGRDDRGQQVSSGNYVVSLSTEGGTDSRKIALVR